MNLISKKKNIRNSWVNKLKEINFVLVLVSVFVIWLAVFVTIAKADEVTLQWDANTEPDLGGYIVHYDIDPGAPYETSIKVPLSDLDNPATPEFTIRALEDFKVYYFAVTAYDTEEPPLESDYSNEVFNKVMGRVKNVRVIRKYIITFEED